MPYELKGIYVEGRFDSIKVVDTMLRGRADEAHDGSVILCTGQRAEAAGDFLFDLAKPDGAFRFVV